MASGFFLGLGLYLVLSKAFIKTAAYLDGFADIGVTLVAAGAGMLLTVFMGFCTTYNKHGGCTRFVKENESGLGGYLWCALCRLECACWC